MGALASLAQREEVRKAIEALRNSRRHRVRRPGPGRRRRRGRRDAARSSPPCCCVRSVGAAEPHDVEPFGPVSHGADLRHHRRGDRARRPRPGQPGRRRWSPTTPPIARQVTSASRRGTAASWCSTVTTQPKPVRQAATAARCRRWCTVGPAGPAVARSSAASAACCTTCSARRSRRPRTCSPPSRDGGRPGPGAATTASTRSARASPSCASATASRRTQRTVTLADIDHFAEFTGDTFYAHTDPEAAAANPLFGGIVAHGYLVVSLAAGLFVEPEPRTGAGQLRRRPPAVPHAGEGRGHHPRSR